MTVRNQLIKVTEVLQVWTSTYWYLKTESAVSKNGNLFHQIYENPSSKVSENLATYRKNWRTSSTHLNIIQQYPRQLQLPCEWRWVYQPPASACCRLAYVDRLHIWAFRNMSPKSAPSHERDPGFHLKHPWAPPTKVHTQNKTLIGWSIFVGFTFVSNRHRHKETAEYQ